MKLKNDVFSRINTLLIDIICIFEKINTAVYVSCGFNYKFEYHE